MDYNYFNELMQNFINKGNFTTPFVDCLITNKNNSGLIKALENGLMIYDYDDTQFDSDKLIMTRTSFSAFIKKDLLNSFSKNLSKFDIFVCVHDHINDHSYVYFRGKKLEFQNIDLTTKFQIIHDELGNPFIKKLEHVWDHGSNIEELKKCITNEQLINNMMQNLIDISVIDTNYNKKGINILDLSLRVLDDLNICN